MNSVSIESNSPLNLEIAQIDSSSISVSPSNSLQLRFSKDSIRNSLRASTLDAIFATVFSITTGGILLGNFLVELNASPVVFGLLSSIPMVVNIIQPLGAYFSERTTSRFQYSFIVYGFSRLLWLFLAIAIIISSWGLVSSQQLIIITLLIVLFSHLLGGLGSASWMSWLAIIVPRRLRGRYFGLRNSATSLTNLLCVPLAGLTVSHWQGGTLQGYGLVLFVGIIFGFISLGCQYFKVDVNPQIQNIEHHITKHDINQPISNPHSPGNSNIWQNSNFVLFLIYFCVWTLAVSLSSPFFNLYMLENLNLDVSWVSIYGSLQAGANLLMLILWGKLADKVGSRRILIVIGILVAITPLLWLGVGTDQLSLWLWLPLLHILAGGTWAAIDLCINNLNIGLAPVKNQTIYFAIAAALSGVSGALGTTIGGLIAEFACFGGLLGLFAISSFCRLAALIPLMFVQEPRT
ncbi:MAG TPA: MFS transporter [Nostocaceae cyanobacterium]|nr:MFS transporter [Nostocaceae cyanobacterium]